MIGLNRGSPSVQNKCDLRLFGGHKNAFISKTSIHVFEISSTSDFLTFFHIIRIWVKFLEVGADDTLWTIGHVIEKVPGTFINLGLLKDFWYALVFIKNKKLPYFHQDQWVPFYSFRVRYIFEYNHHISTYFFFAWSKITLIFCISVGLLVHPSLQNLKNI